MGSAEPGVGGWKEQEVGMPQEQMLEWTMRKKSDQEDLPSKKHQYQWKDSAESACWTTLGDSQGQSLGVNHSLPNQKMPADGLYAVTFKGFLASPMIQLYTLRMSREQLFDKPLLKQINIAQQSRKKSKQTNA